jgi:hypothetical protein
MTRRWFSVIAVLGCVLAITPSASAECAWVLWQEVPVASGGWSLGYGERDRLPNKGGL